MASGGVALLVFLLVAIWAAALAYLRRRAAAQASQASAARAQITGLSPLRGAPPPCRQDADCGPLRSCRNGACASAETLELALARPPPRAN